MKKHFELYSKKRKNSYH